MNLIYSEIQHNGERHGLRNHPGFHVTSGEHFLSVSIPSLSRRETDATISRCSETKQETVLKLPRDLAGHGSSLPSCASSERARQTPGREPVFKR